MILCLLQTTEDHNLSRFHMISMAGGRTGYGMLKCCCCSGSRCGTMLAAVRRNMTWHGYSGMKPWGRRTLTRAYTRTLSFQSLSDTTFQGSICQSPTSELHTMSFSFKTSLHQPLSVMTSLWSGYLPRQSGGEGRAVWQLRQRWFHQPCVLVTRRTLYANRNHLVMTY